MAGTKDFNIIIKLFASYILNNYDEVLKHNLEVNIYLVIISTTITNFQHYIIYPTL